MIIIQEILISDDVFDQKFVCHLDKCKGVCCRSGDYGAPLEKQEIEKIKELYPKLKKHLHPKAIKKIEEYGYCSYYKKLDFEGTPLLEDGSCVYLVEEKDGKLSCSIEKEYNKGTTDLKKPISCHLYPIRVTSNPQTDFTAINYDKWDICNDACSFGEKNNIPLIKFLKEALVRKFGQNFYDEMLAMYDYLRK